MKMKKLLSIGVAACVLATVTLFQPTKAGAQTTTSQVPNALTNTPTFFQSAYLFFTDFNTNYSFENVTVEADTGYAQASGNNAINKLHGQYDLGSTKQFDVGGDVQFSGVGSAINGGELEGGWAPWQHYDSKLQLDLGAGYDDTRQNTKGQRVGSPVIEPIASFKKKLTANTYAVTKVSFPVYFVGRFNSNPTVELGVGFTY